MSCANSTCKNCNETCNTVQNLCKTSQSASDYGGDFSWPVTPTKDTIITSVWTETAWNNLKTAITDAYQAGTNSTKRNQGCTSQGQSFGVNPMLSVNSGDIITAEIYESAAEAVNKLKNDSADTDVKGKVIRDYHATALSSGYNSGEIYIDACDTCNLECNAQCDGCVGCDSCEGVQHYSTCYSSCDTPKE